jgi:hypothetical protein
MLVSARKNLYTKIDSKIQQVMVTILFLYLLGIGGTWWGITNPVVVSISLILVALVWLGSRTSYQPPTIIDPMIPLWMLSITISTLLNTSKAASTLVGVGFAILYIGSWYSLSRWIRLFTKAQIIDAILAAGSLILILSFCLGIWRGETRLGGMLENANILGALLAILIPLFVYKVTVASGKSQLAWIAILVFACVELLWTNSRGASLGILASASYAVWKAFPKNAIRSGAILGIGIIAVLALMVPSRGDSGRLPIYTKAIAQFIPAPLVGNGLFTFRTDLENRFDPIEGGQNVHAHNLFLQIGAELGLVGLIATTVTAAICLRRLDQTYASEFAVVSSLLSLWFQQCVDFTLMTPSIAFSAMILILAITVDSSKAL